MSNPNLLLNAFRHLFLSFKASVTRSALSLALSPSFYRASTLFAPLLTLSPFDVAPFVRNPQYRRSDLIES